MGATVFPDFYIVGAAKAGTTSLVEMLRTHESIYFPHEKEPHHFFLREDERAWTIRDGERILPLAEALPYCKEAPYLGLYRNAPEGALKGDASTQYLVNHTVAGAIHAQRPDAKIIVVLRQPSDRAYSAYLHARSRGEEPLPTFAAALDDCEGGHRQAAFATNYMAEGEYARHLSIWRDLFGDNLLVLLFEDLVSEPQATLDHVTGFLGVSKMQLADASASHKNASVEFDNPLAQGFRMLAKRLRRSAPALFELPVFRVPYDAVLARLGRKPERMPVDQRHRLDAHYASQVDALEAMLGCDLAAWRGQGSDS